MSDLRHGPSVSLDTESKEDVTMGVCPDCGTELTRCRGRRVGTFYLWCWKCEKAVRRPK